NVQAQPEPTPTDRPARPQPEGELEPVGPGGELPEGEGEGEAGATDEEAPEPKPRTVTPEPDGDDPPQPLVLPEPSTLSGHITASASVLWAIPFASLESEIDQGDSMSAGPGFGLDLAFGISRTVALGAWGQMLVLDGGDECSSCSTRSLAGGLFVRYHLVQGVRFDP